MHHYFENVLKLFMIVYILCNQIIGLSSKSSILWKLNDKSGKIDSYSDSHQHLAKEIREIYENDVIFSIIASAGGLKTNDNWQKDVDSTCTSDYLYTHRASNTYPTMHNASQTCALSEINLDCGRPVTFSFYDDLIGISLRYNHPLVPDPEAGVVFLKNKGEPVDVLDLDLLEKRLKKAKLDKPWNAKLFHQIGNFWRIKGDAGKAIDCFRSALIMDPTNAEILHDLARILFTLQYLDDAIFLVRRSLEAQPNNRDTKIRSFLTLGEIFHAYGLFQQSVHYYRQALELNPHNDRIIRRMIREMEDTSPSQIQLYTVIIIFLLVISVLGVMVLTNDFSCIPESVEKKPPRHVNKINFNRAAAMKSLKGLVSRSKSRKL